MHDYGFLVFTTLNIQKQGVWIQSLLPRKRLPDASENSLLSLIFCVGNYRKGTVVWVLFQLFVYCSLIFSCYEVTLLLKLGI